MTSYPGQRSHRSAVAALIAAVVALGVGVAIGWAAFRGDSGTTKADTTPCPAAQYGAQQQARAAACLLDAYLALANQPKTIRDRDLVEIVPPSKLSVFRRGYRPVGEEFDAHTKVYATVAAVKPANGVAADAGLSAAHVGYQAWVAVSVNSTPPRATWYLGDFAVQWKDHRWWLTSAFSYDSTVPTWAMPNDAKAQFGPGWVGL